MTRFVDVHDLAGMVREIGPAAFMRGMRDYVETDFKRWNDFDKSARTAAHNDVGVIELMPIADAELYGFKYVNGHPANTARGLSTIMAFGALAEMETGYPRFLSELTLTTAFRTAATSAMAAAALARPDSRVMALIGSGAQSEFQAIAFNDMLGIDTLRIYDVDAAAMDKLVRHLKAFPAIDVVRSASAKECVSGADIVTTVTADKRWATILTPDMVTPGMHINGIGGDCPGKTELHIDVLRAGKIFVEYEPQTRIEGDIQQLPKDHPVTPLWQVLTGEASGRESADAITIFDSVGFALEDFSALRYVYDLSVELGIGRDIALVPELTDPKDLFELTLDPSGQAFARRAA